MLGLYGIAGASLVGCDAPSMMNALGSSGAGPAVKLAVSFPLVYHYLGAVRHTVSRSSFMTFSALECEVSAQRLCLQTPCSSGWPSPLGFILRPGVFNSSSGGDREMHTLYSADCCGTNELGFSFGFIVRDGLFLYMTAHTTVYTYAESERAREERDVQYECWENRVRGEFSRS